MPSVQVRKDTSARWIAANPVVGYRVGAYESDTGRMKIGDGVTPFCDLPYNLPTAKSISGTTYTFLLTDVNNVVESGSGSGTTFTVPPNSQTAFPVGSVIEVFQGASGQVTISPGSGVTLRSNGNKYKTTAQYATIRLRKRATNEWVLSGDLAV